MAPKGGNAKKEGGRAKKAENEVCPTVHLPYPPNLLPCHVVDSSSHGEQERADGKQEKKAADAQKAKEAKEADDWKSGCKSWSKPSLHFPKDLRPSTSGLVLNLVQNKETE